MYNPRMLTDFDQALLVFSKQGQFDLAKSAALTHDALLLARKICDSVFGAPVPPEVVLAVYDRVIAERALQTIE